MNKILIALDYHPVSETVADQGYALAKKLGAKVCLMHVMADVAYYNTQYPTFMGFEGYGMAAEMDMMMALRDKTEDFLQSAARHLNNPLVETFLAEGDTPNAILQYADDWHADLIVMGTHSHSTLEKLFLGTVASKVIEKTKIPVHLIPVGKK